MLFKFKITQLKQNDKGGSRHKVHHLEERVIFFIRHSNNWSTLHRNALAAWAACLVLRLNDIGNLYNNLFIGRYLPQVVRIVITRASFGRPRADLDTNDNVKSSF